MGTFVNDRMPRAERPRIDRILVTPGVVVEGAAIDTRTFEGVRPSDHLPVQAVVRIAPSGDAS